MSDVDPFEGLSVALSKYGDYCLELSENLDSPLGQVILDTGTKFNKIISPDHDKINIYLRTVESHDLTGSLAMAINGMLSKWGSIAWQIENGQLRHVPLEDLRVECHRWATRLHRIGLIIKPEMVRDYGSGWAEYIRTGKWTDGSATKWLRKGVSERDAALVVCDGDLDEARVILRTWRDQRKYRQAIKSTQIIGMDPEYSSRKLLAPLALWDAIGKSGVGNPKSKSAFLARLELRLRTPIPID